MSDQEIRKLTTVTSNVEYDLLKTFLESEGIPVMYKEHGFGGPIRSVYFGNLKTANMEVYVNAENYDAAKALLDTDFSDLVDQEFEDSLEEPSPAPALPGGNDKQS